MWIHRGTCWFPSRLRLSKIPASFLSMKTSTPEPTPLRCCDNGSGAFVSRTISMLKFGKIRPPVRRVLAVDAGSRCIKLLLAETDFGRLRILKEGLIDLQAEGLVAAAEIKAQLQASLEKWSRPPLALVLPQHLSTSQIVDLPIVSDREAEKLIEDEAIKLTGVS